MWSGEEESAWASAVEIGTTGDSNRASEVPLKRIPVTGTGSRAARLFRAPWTEVGNTGLSVWAVGMRPDTKWVT